MSLVLHDLIQEIRYEYDMGQSLVISKTRVQDGPDSRKTAFLVSGIVLKYYAGDDRHGSKQGIVVQKTLNTLQEAQDFVLAVYEKVHAFLVANKFRESDKKALESESKQINAQRKQLTNEVLAELEQII